jgi:hypothetical protein
VGTGLADGLLGRDLRLILELVDDVAVAGQREPGVVAELAADDNSTASRCSAAARMRSTDPGASGRTSLRRGSRARRTSLAGFAAIRSASTATKRRSRDLHADMLRICR